MVILDMNMVQNGE